MIQMLLTAKMASHGKKVKAKGVKSFHKSHKVSHLAKSSANSSQQYLQPLDGRGAATAKTSRVPSMADSSRISLDAAATPPGLQQHGGGAMRHSAVPNNPTSARTEQLTMMN